MFRLRDRIRNYNVFVPFLLFLSLSTFSISVFSLLLDVDVCARFGFFLQIALFPFPLSLFLEV